jgi:hypothetical protein
LKDLGRDFLNNEKRNNKILYGRERNKKGERITPKYLKPLLIK